MASPTWMPFQYLSSGATASLPSSVFAFVPHCWTSQQWHPRFKPNLGIGKALVTVPTLHSSGTRHGVFGLGDFAATHVRDAKGREAERVFRLQIARLQR